MYLAELLLYSLLLNDSYAGPELKSTDLTECQKRHAINENRQQLNTAKRQKGSYGRVVKLNLHKVEWNANSFLYFKIHINHRMERNIKIKEF